MVVLPALFVMVGLDYLHRPQAFGLLASLWRFRNTVHEVAPFLNGGDDFLARTPSHRWRSSFKISTF
jgi:hypothetical protein